MMREWRAAVLAALVMVLGGCGNGGDEAADPSAASGAEEEAATIESLTENSDRHDGLFTFFVDRDDGTIRMLIGAERLGKEYVYVATVQDAPPITGQFRGNMGEWTKNGVIDISRHFDRIEFVEQNVAFWFDPANPLSRASDANISPAVLAVADILAEDEETGAVLIDAGPVFLSEAFVQLKPPPNPNGNGEPKFDLGSLSDDKTRFTDWRAYPENVDLFVEYVFENPAPVVPGGEDVTDSRYVSIKLQHSFVQIPDNDFVPRSYDPRVGYYLVRVTDLTRGCACSRSRIATSRTTRRVSLTRTSRIRRAVARLHQPLASGEKEPRRRALRPGRADRLLDREHDAAGVPGDDHGGHAGLEPGLRAGRFQ